MLVDVVVLVDVVAVDGVVLVVLGVTVTVVVLTEADVDFVDVDAADLVDADSDCSAAHADRLEITKPARPIAIPELTPFMDPPSWCLVNATVTHQ